MPDQHNQPYTIVRRIDFCYGHRLLNYEGKCAHPHGHNAVAEIELASGGLDEHGMVFDFSRVDEILSDFFDQIDHRMLLHRDDPLVEALEGLQEPFVTMDKNPTAENIAELIFHSAVERGLPVVAVRLWETSSSFAEFRPHRRHDPGH